MHRLYWERITVKELLLYDLKIHTQNISNFRFQFSKFELLETNERHQDPSEDQRKVTKGC